MKKNPVFAFSTFLQANILFFCFSFPILTIPVFSQLVPTPKTPLMGWASWNNFQTNISESLINGQADAMVSSGLAAAGFRYINIDDGFFNGRNADGSLRSDSVKFPNGMKAVSDYIHSKGLKAGIYTEGGENTCGSMWNEQTGGVGAGLYNHDQQDIDVFIKTWGFDFLKVDFCGGLKQVLDEETRYTAVKSAIDKTGRSYLNYNVCRWQFPGTWVTSLADSWRISGDINASWSSISSIIDKNTFLAPYVSPGHYNDMDMLEVGRGMTFTEDQSHFSMWCILSSPLVLGNDLTKLSQQTKDILTNTEVIAMNQDTTGVQAHLVSDNVAGLQVWAKNLNGKQSKEHAVALLNRSSKAASMSIKLKELNLEGGATVRDLWLHTDLGITDSVFTSTVPSHGVTMLKIVGNQTCLKELFEAEYAWINNFSHIVNGVTIPNQGEASIDVVCSGRAKARMLGNTAENYIEFREIYADTPGYYLLSISYLSKSNRNATLSINGNDTLLTNLNSGGGNVVARKTCSVKLNTGYNTIRISNATDWLPDIDKIEIDLDRDGSPSTGDFALKILELYPLAILKPKVKVYPSPNDGDNFIVEFADKGKTYISICDMSGRIVYKTRVYEKSNQLNDLDLKNGAYFLNAESGSNSASKKFIVQR